MARPFGEHTTADEVADTFHDRIKGKTSMFLAALVNSC